MTLIVRHSPELFKHLSEFQVDGATVSELLFEGGRLAYPGRKELENDLGIVEPYTLEHEARIIEGLSRKSMASIRILSSHLTKVTEVDPTLELLWASHAAWSRQGISLDRLVAALVMVQFLVDESETGLFTVIEQLMRDALYEASMTLVRELQAAGFPPSGLALEELCDGAPPAAVGLGLVDIDW